MKILPLILHIITMAVVTYLVRMVPLAIFRKKITNRFIRSFLHYIPYAVLAAMTFPAILQSTSSPISAAIGLGVAVVSACFDMGLLPVALLSCGGVFITELFL